MSEPPVVLVANPELPAEVGAIIVAIEEMTVAVDGVRCRLESGETVLVEGLDERMGAVYAAVEKTGGDDVTPRLMPPLRILAESLDRLERALKAHKPRPAPTAPPRRAAEAYGAAPRPAGPPPREDTRREDTRREDTRREDTRRED